MALAPAARPLAVVTRVKSRVPAAISKCGLQKAVKCLCSGAAKARFQVAVSGSNAEVTLSALEQLGLPEVDVLALKQAGLIE